MNCGAPIADDAQFAPNATIVVEVLSSSTNGRDLGEKYIDYFRVPSIEHYLVIDLNRRLVLHHSRSDAGTMVTEQGSLRLDPPGIEIQLDGIFPPA